MKELQSSLFVNIMPIFTDRMASIEDRSGTIPVRDFCRLVALYQTMKLSWERVSGVRSRLFPDSKSVTNYYGLVLSQLSLLTRLGLLTQVGVKGRAISLNQLLYRCNMK